MDDSVTETHDEVDVRLHDAKAMGPRGRSRAGDFAFAYAAGLAALIVTAVIGSVHVPLALGIGLFFSAALLMRYLTLRDEPAVPVKISVSADQLATLERLRALLNALPQPLFLLDDEGKVEMFNPAAETRFGDDLSGRHLSSIIRNPRALDALREARATHSAREVEVSFTGAQTWTSLFFCAPLVETDDGIVDGRVIVMLRDRTEQRKLERMRTDFIANASHELRTPLTSMTGFIETLQGHAKEDPAARERFLGIMADQTQRMLRLVEDLINLSAIELAEAKPPAEKVDLSLLARNVVENLQPLADRAGASLSVEVPDGVRVIGDRNDLFRLVSNLGENAIKYGESPEDGKSRVALTVGRGLPPQKADADRSGDSPAQIAVRAGIMESDLVWVRIEDQGAGIERNDLPRLTERFYRVSAELSRAKGGTGLGLAIVKHILQRHRGGLLIESRQGHGAAFTCILPGGLKTPATAD